MLTFAPEFNQKSIQAMTKVEIVSEISRATGVAKGDVLAVIEEFMESVKDAVVSGENVYLRGFGTFGTKTRAAKTARNIKANTSIAIPEHKIPWFKPCASFKESVK